MQEADTDDNQGTLGFEEFCSFYKMMSTRRDLYLLMLTYSNHKDHLDTDDLTRFLETEQKVRVFCSGLMFSEFTDVLSCEISANLSALYILRGSKSWFLASAVKATPWDSTPLTCTSK